MEKETKIAKENVGQSSLLMKRYPKPKINKEHFGALIKGAKLMESMKLHKQTCQRWLEFLDDKLYDGGNRMIPCNRDCDINYIIIKVDKKIADLKQAIKIYNEAGI